jgi:hypothetical protein
MAAESLAQETANKEVNKQAQSNRSTLTIVETPHSRTNLNSTG